jgi:hypothetical protein
MVSLEHLTCPSCDKLLSTAVEWRNAAAVPEPGDANLCMSCSYVSIFTEDGNLRAPTIAERRELLNDPDIAQAQRAWTLWKAKQT